MNTNPVLYVMDGGSWDLLSNTLSVLKSLYCRSAAHIDNFAGFTLHLLMGASVGLTQMCFWPKKNETLMDH